jgi:hypothetical protein
MLSSIRADVRALMRRLLRMRAFGARRTAIAGADALDRDEA